jgi:hypothetical protein
MGRIARAGAPVSPDEDNAVRTTRRLSWADVTRYALRGVPLSTKALSDGWTSISTPSFPILYCLLAALVPTSAGVIMGLASKGADVPWSEVLTSSLGMLALMWWWVPFLSSVLTLCWCMLILLLFRSPSREKSEVVRGAQRVTYFAGLSQLLFYLVVFGTPFLCGGSDAGLVSKLGAFSLVLIAGVIRIGVVYQGLRAETGGNCLAGILGCLVCLDVLVGVPWIAMV